MQFLIYVGVVGVFQQIKENGGLAKLLAFIVDAPPPEEEDTKSKAPKGKEKGGSRAGKKGKEEGLSNISPF